MRSRWSATSDPYAVSEPHARNALLWLAPWKVLREQCVKNSPLHRLACRADAESVEAGEGARIARAFDILPRGLPVAALTRAMDAGDTLGFTWLRADPGFVRADMATVRLYACGELDVSPQECEALLTSLKPLFGDEGFLISAPVPSRWYLCLPDDTRLPHFDPPGEVIGDDLFAHMPDGDLGRRWRRLMNEAQVILHNHEVNARRAAQGKLPVNTLWFWGAGRLPDHVRSDISQLRSGDPLLHALAGQARVQVSTDAQAATLPPAALVDLREVGDAALIEEHWIVPLVEQVRRGALEELRLDFGDGRLLCWRVAHRWRFWRTRLPT